jgi:hypothetical protein
LCCINKKARGGAMGSLLYIFLGCAGCADSKSSRRAPSRCPFVVASRHTLLEIDLCMVVPGVPTRWRVNRGKVGESTNPEKFGFADCRKTHPTPPHHVTLVREAHKVDSRPTNATDDSAQAAQPRTGCHTLSHSLTQSIRVQTTPPALRHR